MFRSDSPVSSVDPAGNLFCMSWARGHFVPAAAADPEMREELYTSFFVSRRIVFFVFLVLHGSRPVHAARSSLAGPSIERKKNKLIASTCLFPSR